jgi:hypothetical protein
MEKMIYEEIAKIIEAEGIIVQDTEKLAFIPNSVYLNQLSTSPLRFGQSITVEMVVLDDKDVKHLYEIIVQAIGTRGTFGEYVVKRITYSPENPKEALDKIWAVRCMINLTVEEV